ncbi:uncharacterized protein LOC119436965 [Dermacentor silvarum]|uniref:uncharacterized protein LOC119436965 n=1 Tax=Dermacentor silvarum TaxID=543639 RepID=UPI002101BC58|nr:uncharacterized protein LOC119436965 [Dermacentor silvarum]
MAGSAFATSVLDAPLYVARWTAGHIGVLALAGWRDLIIMISVLLACVYKTLHVSPATESICGQPVLSYKDWPALAATAMILHIYAWPTLLLFVTLVNYTSCIFSHLLGNKV